MSPFNKTTNVAVSVTTPSNFKRRYDELITKAYSATNTTRLPITRISQV